ncbi:PQ loop repeat protein [Aspergillus sclerotialis]|uniref:PQ loop repeat protein n=1 Tax=Aspergillus sclerotialis TaxID=2070753 RepID=A0A3A2ZSI4_9EURO|nr:PQ loop repeat protein [Aspergillus sclerotialis]
MDPLNPHCQQLAAPSYLNFILSILILFGILISYLPQHYRIISLRSSFGISPYFVLLGTTSATNGFANILVLPRSARDVSCCKEINGLACFAGILGILQVGVQTLCFWACLALFVIYFPRATSPVSTVTTPESSSKDSPTYRSALIVTAICLLHALVVLIISIAFAVRRPESLQAWANFLGVFAAILSSIQYFPQIYTTFRLRCVGSLSIPTMCIQTPGSLVWAGSLAARLGTEGWSTWGVYVVTACLQGTLLIMAVYFEYFGPKKKESHHHDNEAPDGSLEEEEEDRAHADHHRQATEETPLLEND